MADKYDGAAQLLKMFEDDQYPTSPAYQYVEPTEKPLEQTYPLLSLIPSVKALRYAIPASKALKKRFEKSSKFEEPEFVMTYDPVTNLPITPEGFVPKKLKLPLSYRIKEKVKNNPFQDVMPDIMDGGGESTGPATRIEQEFDPVRTGDIVKKPDITDIIEGRVQLPEIDDIDDLEELQDYSITGYDRLLRKLLEYEDKKKKEYDERQKTKIEREGDGI